MTIEENDNLFRKYSNLFENWKEKNKITQMQECIFIRILFKMCDNDWEKWTPIDHIRLMDGYHITCEEYVKIINQLESLGLIEYRAEKYKWPVYKLGEKIFSK